jgi:hypothetical protein
VYIYLEVIKIKKEDSGTGVGPRYRRVIVQADLFADGSERNLNEKGSIQGNLESMLRYFKFGTCVAS